MRIFLLSAMAATMFAATGCGVPQIGPRSVPQMAVPDLPPMRSFPATPATPPRRSNAEMVRDFMDLTFRLESGRDLPLFTRFEGPVRVQLIGNVPASAQRDLGRVLSRFRAEAGIDISRSSDADSEITVEFLPRRVMQRLVPRAACFVAPRVSSWAEYRRAGRSQLDWTTLTQRDRAAIFIPNDTAPQEMRDCLHEELAQSLGPLNDLYRLPDSVFNDDNVHTVLTGFDMLMLRIYYSPDLQSGMRPGEVAVRLPTIIRRYNPRGESVPSWFLDPTPRAYVDAIETALGPGTSPSRRRAAAQRALSIARDRNWSDVRAGFAWLALGRLSLGHDAELAETAFAQAAAVYASRPGQSLHVAHAEMQLAAFALSQGRAEDTIALADSALPVVSAAENAALLANLLMVKSAALDLVGRVNEARIVRLDSLGWARYGFASDMEVLLRLDNISALSPVHRMRQQ